MADARDILAPQSAPQIVDCWSRTSPKYVVRAVVMLLLLAVLFAGLCCFTFWLRTGYHWPPSYEGYGDLLRRSFTPTGTNQVTLSQFLSSPINVQIVPIHSVIVGLLFACLCSIPILVAILYRFPSAIIFTAMVMFLAAMPWLALTVLLGCALASLPPFRFTFRYASALLGLIPVAIYFVSASWEPAGSNVRSVQNRALFYAPWVLAFLGSCIICALSLAFARLINYRPGGVAPVLAMIFAIPVYLFHAQVGRDELEYRVLEREVGVQSATLFVPANIGAKAHEIATRHWNTTPTEYYQDIYQRVLQRAIADALLRAENDRATAVARCDWFIEHFSGSRYVPAVYFLKGQAQDRRIRRARLLNDQRVEYRDDLPGRASLMTWKTIEERFPDSQMRAAASYKLAILSAQNGDFDQAIAALDDVVRRFSSGASTQPAPADLSRQTSMFQKADPSKGLGIDLRVTIRLARRLKEIFENCSGDHPIAAISTPEPAENSPSSIHPLQLLFSLDDAHPQYRAHLAGIATTFKSSATAGYAVVRLGHLEPAISRRIDYFRRIADQLRGHPAYCEAMYYLAEVLQEDSLVEDARQVLQDLVRDCPQSCWAEEAHDRLTTLPMLEQKPL